MCNAATVKFDQTQDGLVDLSEMLPRVVLTGKWKSRWQCSTSILGRPDGQAFVGSLVGLGATKGVSVTTSSFVVRSVIARDGQNGFAGLHVR